MAAVRVVNLEAERRMLQTAKKTKAAELTNAKITRARLLQNVAAAVSKVNKQPCSRGGRVEGGEADKNKGDEKRETEMRPLLS